MANITQQQFDAEMLKLIPTADSARRVGLQRAVLYMRAQGASLAGEVARLRAEDGATAATTLDLAAQFQAQGVQSTQATAEIAANDFSSRLSAVDTVATGTVTNAGAPAVGFHVALLTDQNVSLGEAVVDRSGAFAISAVRAEFDKKIGTVTSIRVQIKDATGKLLQETRTDVRVGVAQVLVLNFELGRLPVRLPISLDTVRGLGQARIAKLNQENITDAADVATAAPETLAKLLSVSLDQAKGIIKDAADAVAASPRS